MRPPAEPSNWSAAPTAPDSGARLYMRAAQSTAAAPHAASVLGSGGGAFLRAHAASALQWWALRGAPEGGCYHVLRDDGSVVAPDRSTRHLVSSTRLVVNFSWCARRLPAHPDLVPLSAPSTSREASWAKLGLAAQATGAFPLFLRARALSRSGGDYAQRELLIPGDRHPGSMHAADQVGVMQPDWPRGRAPALRFGLRQRGGGGR